MLEEAAAAASTTSRRSRLSLSRVPCSELEALLVPEDLERPLFDSKEDERMLSMLVAICKLLLDLVLLLLTDKSSGDSCVVLEASDSKEPPLLDTGSMGTCCRR